MNDCNRVSGAMPTGCLEEFILPKLADPAVCFSSW